MRKRDLILCLTVLVSLVSVLAGCSTPRPRIDAGSMNSKMITADNLNFDSSSFVNNSRKLVKRVYVDMSVWNVGESVEFTKKLIKEQGGYISDESINEEESSRLTIRIPADKLLIFMEKLKNIGDITRNDINTEDITNNYIDTNAQLNNQIVLASRLRELLKKAKNVNDILQIEKELARVQSKIDYLQGVMDTMDKQVSYSTVNLRLERKVLLGPLGYVFKGLWWGIEKLFVIRS